MRSWTASILSMMSTVIPGVCMARSRTERKSVGRRWSAAFSVWLSLKATVGVLSLIPISRLGTFLVYQLSMRPHGFGFMQLEHAQKTRESQQALFPFAVVNFCAFYFGHTLSP